MGTPDDVGNSAILDQVQGALGSNQSKLNTGEGSGSERWKPPASATTRPPSHGVKESADSLPPLVSVIGGPSGVEGSEPAQSPHLHPGVSVEGVTESVPGGEGCDVGGKEAAPIDDPLTSISQGGKPNSK